MQLISNGFELIVLCVGNYSRDQGNNRGYNNSYDNRREGGGDFSRNYDRPPNNYNRRDGGNGGFMSRDRGERDNNRFDFRVSINFDP